MKVDRNKQDVNVNSMVVDDMSKYLASQFKKHFISSFLYICFIYYFVEFGESLKIYIDCLWYW